MNSKYNMFVIVLVLGTILASIFLVYNYRERLHIAQLMTLAKDRFFVQNHQRLHIKLVVNATVNDQGLSINYYIPCETIEQRQQILNTMPRIKSDLIISFSKPEMAHCIENRDFKRIKKHFITIINKYTDKKINKLYMTYFNLFS